MPLKETTREKTCSTPKTSSHKLRLHGVQITQPRVNIHLFKIKKGTYVPLKEMTDNILYKHFFKLVDRHKFYLANLSFLRRLR